MPDGNRIPDETSLGTATPKRSLWQRYRRTLLLGVVPAPFIVPDEIATTYEFGAKSRFWGGRALLSLAAYHLDIKGYQDSYFDGNLVGFLVRSLPAKSSGLELEGQVQANGWLNIYGNIGWNPTAKLRLPNGVEERLQRAARFTGE